MSGNQNLFVLLEIVQARILSIQTFFPGYLSSLSFLIKRVSWIKDSVSRLGDENEE